MMISDLWIAMIVEIIYWTNFYHLTCHIRRKYSVHFLDIISTYLSLKRLILL